MLAPTTMRRGRSNRLSILASARPVERLQLSRREPLTSGSVEEPLFLVGPDCFMWRRVDGGFCSDLDGESFVLHDRPA